MCTSEKEPTQVEKVSRRNQKHLIKEELLVQNTVVSTSLALQRCELGMDDNGFS